VGEGAERLRRDGHTTTEGRTTVLLLQRLLLLVRQCALLLLIFRRLIQLEQIRSRGRVGVVPAERVAVRVGMVVALLQRACGSVVRRRVLHKPDAHASGAHALAHRNAHRPRSRRAASSGDHMCRG